MTLYFIQSTVYRISNVEKHKLIVNEILASHVPYKTGIVFYFWFCRGKIVDQFYL